MPTDSHSGEELVLQDLVPIITGALHRFRALLPADIKLAVELFCEDPRVRADAGQLERALVSVFIIAWQSMVGVAKHVVVSFREVLLDDIGVNPDAAKSQGGLPPKRYGWLSVTNSSREAPGPFHELLPAPTLMNDRPSIARRLQLVEVRDIIEKHQGMITVLTEPGRGTAFEIYLPTVLSMETSAASLAGTDIKHIVYVDDYGAMRELISDTLPDAGFRVTCYENGKTALAAIQADPSGCDALVTDYRLQGYSGIELLAEIKRICPSLPVIIISGYVDKALKAKAHEQGALLVISKSRDVSELYIALRRLLSRKPNQR